MRESEITRKTKETDITVKLTLDGRGESEISTGIGFFDHMLTALSRHSGISMAISCRGDLEVDCHHTVEDVGIVLGKALSAALGEAPVARYGYAVIPMDEAIGSCALDICSRAYLVFDCAFANERMGELDSCMVSEFFRALAFNSGMTLHLSSLYGVNDHHRCEAMFKAFAHALSQATCLRGDALSTKGTL